MTCEFACTAAIANDRSDDVLTVVLGVAPQTPAAAPTGREFTAIVNDALDYQWTAPFVSDSARFGATFGPVQTTAHADAVALTLTAMRGG